MSKIYFPDARWIDGEWPAKPDDGQLCSVITIQLEDSGIYVYVGKDDVFIDFSLMSEVEIPKKNVEWWRPLGLPEETESRMLSEFNKHYKRGDK